MPDVDDSEWAELLREQARAGLLALTMQRIGDLKEEAPERAMLVCDQYLRIDPEELEVHAARVELARQLGNPVLLAQVTAAYELHGGDSDL